MKLFKLKIGFLTMVCSSLFLVSCGGDSSTEPTESEEQKVAYEVEVNALFKNKKENKIYTDKDQTQLFTGTAGEKNSDDKLIYYIEVKNGFMTKEKEWRDFGGELILTCDMELKDGKKFNGWYNEIVKEELYTVTMSHRSYSNGKETDFWVIEEGSGLYSGRPAKLYLNDEVLCESAKKTDVFGYLEDKNSGLQEYYQHAVNFIDCVKSQNLKNFHIYINE
jgi:hypothetical protein